MGRLHARKEELWEDGILFGHVIRNDRVCCKFQSLLAEALCNKTTTQFSFSPRLPHLPAFWFGSFKLRPSFCPNLPVTAACKFQALSIHICHPPCHQHLTRWSSGFQIWPGITLRQASMIDSSCIYSIVSQRQEKTRRLAVATAKEFYVKNCGL